VLTRAVGDDPQREIDDLVESPIGRFAEPYAAAERVVDVER